MTRRFWQKSPLEEWSDKGLTFTKAENLSLSSNLGVPAPLLQVAMIDDPLQSLDDVNSLSLIDLLHRVKDCRQMIMSTYDSRWLIVSFGERAGMGHM